MAGATPAASCPGDLTRPSTWIVVAGLPRSWQTAPSITIASAARAEIGVPPPRLVDHHERVRPDVAFGMPLRILRAVVERDHLGQQLFDHAQLARQREADRRALGHQQQLLELAPDSLRRQVVERDRRGRCSRSPAPASARSGPRTAAPAARAASRRRSAPDPRRAGPVRRGPRGRSNGSRYSPVSGSHAIALMVKSRRRAASSIGIDGSPSTANPLCPRPLFDSRRGSATSIAPSLKTGNAWPTGSTRPSSPRTAGS